jgi:hypothetical protein
MRGLAVASGLRGNRTEVGVGAGVGEGEGDVGVALHAPKVVPTIATTITINHLQFLIDLCSFLW